MIEDSLVEMEHMFKLERMFKLLQVQICVTVCVCVCVLRGCVP